MGLDNINAYELIEEKTIADINAKGYILKHKVTGARVCCISNDDENKVFYIGFRTPPVDSTGVPHIIEHSVLCGSKKYPAKDPFVELAKGSLNTFLNAMTYPDKTVYPVASCNDQDFANLMDVYLDAVFHPNIYTRPQIFSQEGWHYELESPDDELKFNGVVYNEMKGVYSSPDDVFDRAIFDSLFPDTCYGVESGGDPDYIPTLTYEQFLDFHKRYYHPSNSYIYLYGDMDIEERLDYIDREYLSEYSRLDIDSTIGMQKPFGDIRRVSKTYSITNDEPLSDNTYMSYNCVVETSLDEIIYVAFQVLDYALVSAPGAVLKQALLDAGICKDVQSGYDNGVLQPYYSIVIKNTNDDCENKFVELVNNVLCDVVKNGFDKKSLRAALNGLEFKFREADFGHYPKGLMYGLQALDSWLYDDEKPFIHIEALHTFEYLKEQVDKGYFEELVQKYLLDNDHRTIVVMSPERGLTARKDKELADRLLAYKEELSAEEIQKLCDTTAELRRYQEEPDSDEILDMIPLLKVSDIRKEAEPFIYDVKKCSDYDFITHDIFTGGIGYLSVGFDITDIEDKYLPYVGIIKGILGSISTKNYEYADLANEIFLNSGGIAASTTISNDSANPEKYSLNFEIRSKVLYEKIDFAYEMIGEIINTSRYDDKKRIHELIMTMKSQMQASMMSTGHVISSHRAMSHISRAEDVIEKMSGIKMYRLIEKIESDFDNSVDELIANLEATAGMIFTKACLKYVDFTATKDQFEIAQDLGTKLAKTLKEGEKLPGNAPVILEKTNEAFKTSSKVMYVAKAGRYLDDDHPYTGALKVLKVIMGYDYLWNQVRVQGGAYGAFATFYKAGEGCFSSYRDPNLAKTIETYDKVVQYLKSFDVNDRDMTKYIIGTIADMDFPLTPAAKGIRGLSAYLANESMDNVQRERDEVLGADAKSIRNLAEYMQKLLDSASVCVVGGEELIEKSNDLFDNVAPLIQG